MYSRKICALNDAVTFNSVSVNEAFIVQLEYLLLLPSFGKTVPWTAVAFMTLVFVRVFPMLHSPISSGSRLPSIMYVGQSQVKFQTSACA